MPGPGNKIVVAWKRYIVDDEGQIEDIEHDLQSFDSGGAARRFASAILDEVPLLADFRIYYANEEIVQIGSVNEIVAMQNGHAKDGVNTLPLPEHAKEDEPSWEEIKEAYVRGQRAWAERIEDESDEDERGSVPEEFLEFYASLDADDRGDFIQMLIDLEERMEEDDSETD